MDERSWVRGCNNIPNHLPSDFYLQLCCYWSAFKTCRYVVYLGILGFGRTIFWLAFSDFILVLVLECNPIVWPITRLNGSLQWQCQMTTASLLSVLRAQLTDGQVRSNHKKRYSETIYPKQQLFQKKNNMNKMHGMSKFPSTTTTITKVLLTLSISEGQDVGRMYL